MIAATVN